MLSFGDVLVYLSHRDCTVFALAAADAALALSPTRIYNDTEPGRPAALVALEPVRYWLSAPTGVWAPPPPSQRRTVQKAMFLDLDPAVLSAFFAAQAAYQLPALGNRGWVDSEYAATHAIDAGVSRYELWLGLAGFCDVPYSARPAWATLATDGWEGSLDELTDAAALLSA